MHDEAHDAAYVLLHRWLNIAMNGRFGGGRYALKNHPLVKETNDFLDQKDAANERW